MSADLPADQPRDDTGHCAECDEDVPTHDLLGHLRVMHPDVYVEPERWPDGSIVLEEDFDSPEALDD